MIVEAWEKRTGMKARHEETEVVIDVEAMLSDHQVETNVTSDEVEVYKISTQTPSNRRSASYIVTDSGVEITTLRSGWRITQKEEMPSISIGGPSSKMGCIHMHRGTRVTKVKSVNLGWVIFRATNNALIYPEELRDKETERPASAYLNLGILVFM